MVLSPVDILAGHCRAFNDSAFCFAQNEPKSKSGGASPSFLADNILIWLMYCTPPSAIPI
jgi:hypothetical protein